VRVAALVAATAWLCVALAAGGDDWIGGGRQSWWQPVALFVAGSLVDAALAPSDVLAGPALASTWLAMTASDRTEARTLYLPAVTFSVLSVMSLVGTVDLGGDDGAVARSAALGALLVTLGLLGARRNRRFQAVARPGGDGRARL
jgi:hypothetical protein